MADKWEKEVEARRKKASILRCQWRKKTGEEVDCDACPDRFTCFGLKARRFVIFAYYTGYNKYETFAENREEAHDLMFDFCGEDGIVNHLDDYSEGDDQEIVEYNEKGEREEEE